MMDEKKKKKFRSGLVAINNGTRYDVHGKLKGLAREIEQGKHGDVRDVIVLVKTQVQGTYETSAYHFGTCTVAECGVLIKRGERDIIG